MKKSLLRLVYGAVFAIPLMLVTYASGVSGRAESGRYP